MNTPALRHWELPGDHDRVLAGWPLRPGLALEQTSRFSDDRWQLEPAILQRHVPSKSLNFLLVPSRYRLPAKQFLYAMIAGPLPAGERRQKLLGLPGVFTFLRRFLQWLDNRPTAPRLSEVTDLDLGDYHRYLVLAMPHTGSRGEAHRTVQLLWRYRSGMSDPLRIDPRRVDDWRGHYQRGPENSTARIPEQVLIPLITWSIRFVDDFAEDIFAADRHRQLLETQTPTTIARHIFHQQLRTYLDAYIDQGRPLPGIHGRPHMRFIARTLGADEERVSTSSSANHSMVLDAFAKVGATENTLLDIQIAGTLDEQPWLRSISLNHSCYSVTTLQRMLQIACYITIAFLSGMRDSEIKHLRRGSVTVARDEDGRPYRWKLAGRAFKGTNDPAGVPASWVIGHPAARAVEILERLQPPEQPILFANLPRAAGKRSRDPDNAQMTKTTNSQMVEFVEWIARYCVDHRRDDAVPPVNGIPWTLSTSQFRRTLAWFIARRPGGSIAGAIAFRHLSIHMFEGYAGTSDSGFRGEVESEQALARGEHLLALIDAHEHTQLTGPAGDEAQRRLEQFGEQARFAGAVVTDDRRLQRLLRRADPAIYPGIFATCVFDPQKALCQHDRDRSGTARPSLGTCRPTECANAALTTGNLAALRAELNHLDRQIALRPSLPPLLQHRLRTRRTHIAEFVARHTPEKP
ncbi:hypothetical protein ACFWVM_00970 [Nocardia fluminea]|uniref:hypothetical protein n=1 Tax=Nocardia fluminea TaxID=134984 RepID=UPI00366A19D9